MALYNRKKQAIVEHKEAMLEELASIGEEENTIVRRRGKIPDNLTDVLLQRLSASVRARIAQRLVDIALQEKDDRLALNAITEVFDRIEGKARQTTLTGRDKNDPMLELLGQLFKEEPKLVKEAGLESLGSLIDEA